MMIGGSLATPAESGPPMQALLDRLDKMEQAMVAKEDKLRSMESLLAENLRAKVETDVKLREMELRINSLEVALADANAAVGGAKDEERDQKTKQDELTPSADSRRERAIEQDVVLQERGASAAKASEIQGMESRHATNNLGMLMAGVHRCFDEIWAYIFKAEAEANTRESGSVETLEQAQAHHSLDVASGEEGTTEASLGGYSFGGTFTRLSANNGHKTCDVINPVTGACTCPPGFDLVRIFWLHWGGRDDLRKEIVACWSAPKVV